MIINEDNSMTSNTEYNIKVHSENSMENYNTVSPLVHQANISTVINTNLR